jgi:hypothetical protein
MSRAVAIEMCNDYVIFCAIPLYREDGTVAATTLQRVVKGCGFAA